MERELAGGVGCRTLVGITLQPDSTGYWSRSLSTGIGHAYWVPTRVPVILDCPEQAGFSTRGPCPTKAPHSGNTGLLAKSVNTSILLSGGEG